MSYKMVAILPIMISFFALLSGAFVIYTSLLDHMGNVTSSPKITNTRHFFYPGVDQSEPRLKAENDQALWAFLLLYIAAILMFVKGVVSGIYMYSGKSYYSDVAIAEMSNRATRVNPY